MTRSSRVLAALGGVLSALAGLAAGSLTAAVLGSRLTPVVAVGSAFIDRVPPWLKDLAIQLFGTHDKTALRAGIVVVLLLLAAASGLLAVRRPQLGLAIAAGLALVAVAAAMTRPDAGPADALPAALAGVVSMVCLYVLSGRLAVAVPEEGGRRGFLRLAGGVALGSAGVAGLARGAGGKRIAVAEARERLRLPLPASTAPPPGVQAEGAVPWQTPNPEFYRIDTSLSVPLMKPADWRLRIHGMVDRELTLTYDDLLRRPVVHRWITLCCVSNEVGGGLIGNALWSGVLLKDLLAAAGPHADADAVLATSIDGFTCGTPLQAMTDGRAAMLAFGMNGEPLPVEHGFPVRVVVPGLYGYVSATKWVMSLEVSRFEVADRPAVVEGEGRPGRRGRGRLAPARRHLGGRGTRRRRPLAAHDPGRAGLDRLLAPVALDLGRRARQPHPPGPRHRRHRHPADRGRRPTRPRRRHRPPHRQHQGHVILHRALVTRRVVTHRALPTKPVDCAPWTSTTTCTTSEDCRSDHRLLRDRRGAAT